jgi:hypothetical protein
MRLHLAFERKKKDNTCQPALGYDIEPRSEKKRQREVASTVFVVAVLQNEHVASKFALCRGQSPDFRTPVPAKKTQSLLRGPGACWDVAEACGACADIEATMRDIIPFVQERLRVCLTTGQAVLSQFQDK